MKPLIQLTLSVVLLFFATWLPAQAFEQIKGMSQGAHHALLIEIDQADEKLVAEVWRNFLKERYQAKQKWDRKAKEHFADDVLIPSIGMGNTVDVYAATEARGNNVLFTAWFDLGGAYLSSQMHPDRFAGAESLLLEFKQEVAREKVRQELKTEEDNLRKLQKDLERLKAAQERAYKEIEKARDIIRKAETDIAKNEQDQEAMLQQINRQQSAIDAVIRRLGSM